VVTVVSTPFAFPLTRHSVSRGARPTASSAVEAMCPA
jgi:hypothetical protein